MSKILSTVFSRFAPPAVIAAVLMLGLAAPGFAQSQNSRQFVSVGTGGVTGVYYPAGGAICRLVNRGRRTHGIRCSVESTGGSADNIQAIRTQDMDFGVVQSDTQYAAVHGEPPFADEGPFKNLRSVFALHPEPFTVVARADADIKTFSDLKGKRVNVGNPGSGQRGTMEAVMGALGWKMSDFAEASELTSAEQSKALCDGKIDAMVFTVGHPNASIKEATITCDTVILDVVGPEIDKLISQTPYYQTSVIPARLYRGTNRDVKTFGVGATFVSSTLLPPDVVYEVVKAVFNDFDDFRRLHPAFARLEKENMLKGGMSAPMHEGAIRYFQEVGLME